MIRTGEAEDYAEHAMHATPPTLDFTVVIIQKY